MPDMKIFLTNKLACLYELKIELGCQSKNSLYKKKCLLHLGHVKRKIAFKHVQNAQIQIILRLRKISPGPVFTIHTFCNIQ